MFTVGVFCLVSELERREASRNDGELEGRPLGLARRSSELCHSHGVEYDVSVWTDSQSTQESVDLIVAALRSSHLRFFLGARPNPKISSW